MSKIDDGTMAIIREAAREAADQTIQRHMDACPIARLAKDVWEPNGIKEKVTVMHEAIASLHGWGSRAWQLVTPLLTAAIVACATWVIAHHGK